MLRVLPTSFYNTPAIETWLEDLSRKGVHIECFFGIYAIQAEKGEPRNETYRLEAGDGKPAPDAERLEAYHAAGWEHIATTPDNELWLFRATRPDPLPIHTDPETQYLAFRRLRWRPWVYMAFWLAMAGMCIAIAVRRPRIWALHGFIIRMFLPVYWVSFCLGDILALGKLLRPLRAGIPLDHHAPYRQTRRWWFWSLLITFVAYACFALSSM